MIHGAWHGGWCWRWLAPLLREQGHEVYAPTLTGLGERAHLLAPEIDLTTHIDDILGVLRYEDLADVVLVGHSYGGMVVSGVVEHAPERIQENLEAYETAMSDAGYEADASKLKALYQFASFVDMLSILAASDLPSEQEMTSDDVREALKATEEFESFLGAPITCDGNQYPDRPSGCSSEVLYLEVQDDLTMKPKSEAGFMALDTSVIPRS